VNPDGIGLLHPGSMGAAVARQAISAGARVHWLPEGRGAATRGRADEAGLVPAADLATLTRSCWLIISLCPPANAAAVADAVAAAGFTGVYLDANAISPRRSESIAQALALRGATTLDGGVVGPPPRRPGTTRLYLSGPQPAAADVAAVFADTALTPTVLPGPVGQASALKLAFASYNKITYLLAAQAAALANAHNVLPELFKLTGEQLADTPLGSPDRLRSAAPRAWRWGPEMREIADACAAAGLTPDLALVAEQLLARWDAHKDDANVPLDRLIADLTGLS
jgi:3-hydroxyisobutyrate dehydrogenase-like beta-hydroxyacid dehydrogenase